MWLDVRYKLQTKRLGVHCHDASPLATATTNDSLYYQQHWHWTCSHCTIASTWPSALTKPPPPKESGGGAPYWSFLQTCLAYHSSA